MALEGQLDRLLGYIHVRVWSMVEQSNGDGRTLRRLMPSRLNRIAGLGSWTLKDQEGASGGILAWSVVVYRLTSFLQFFGLVWRERGKTAQ